jgi:protein neuralized
LNNFKDVANTPEEGDELSFCVRPDGSVEFSKNGGIPSVFMHVDNSVNLWAFWDIYGNTQRLRMVGLQCFSSVAEL